jgi:3-oxoadipate enol-lactonase
MMIELKSVTLNVVVDGPADAPAITFSNSLMTDTRLWDRQMRDLARDFRVIRYDQRGHGASSASAEPYGFDELADDIVGIWDHLGIARSHLVGLSMGGMTALGLALGHPDRLNSCTMCSMRADAPLAFRESWNERIDLANAQGMGALAAPTAGRWFPADYSDAAVRALVEDMVESTSLEGFLGGVAAIRGLDYLDRVASLRVPSLFLAGGSDGVLPQAMKDLAERTDGSQYRLFEGAGHLINLERPQEFSQAIADFVRGHQAQPAVA